MFERFTDRARRVNVLAQEEARQLKHNYIGTEHILLGLLHEGEGIASQALTALGISADGVRKQVEAIIGIGQNPPMGHIPYTPRAKKVLELSLREALQLGHNYIGTEHILLGLIREGEGVAAQTLVKLGVELTVCRQQIIQLLSGYKGKGAEKIYASENLASFTFPPAPSHVAQLLMRELQSVEAQLAAVEKQRAELQAQSLKLEAARAELIQHLQPPQHPVQEPPVDPEEPQAEAS